MSAMIGRRARQWIVLAGLVAALPLAAAQPSRFAIREFRIAGSTLLAPETLQHALRTLLGENRTAETLLEARAAVLKAYLDAGYAMVSAEVSAAAAHTGVIHVQVSEIRVGRVSVSGNRQFSEAMIRRALPALREGEAPRLDRLARQLFLANDNGALRLALEYRPGGPGRTDVDVKAAEQEARRFAVTLDNTGTRATGKTRIGAIAHFANLWDRGHLGTLSYVKSLEHPDRVTQAGIFYVAPLPRLGDALELTLVHSSADAGRVAEVFDVSGEGDIVGARYVRTLARDAFGKQTLAAGVDEKHYRNTTDFFGFNLGVDVNARPLTLAYAYRRWLGERTLANFGLQYSRNLTGGAKNDDATYGASRAGADARWSAWRGQATLQHTLGSGWMLAGRFEGQYTREPLISAEQFGLGGARSVRGLVERETAGDRGHRGSLELYTPRLGESQRLLGFIDSGSHSRLNALPGEQAGESVTTFGVGWRAAWKSGLSFAADIGVVADGTPVSEEGDSRGHVSIAWWF